MHCSTLKDSAMLLSIAQTIKEVYFRLREGPRRRQSILPEALLKYFDSATPIVVVDVGANEGSFSRAIAEYCGIEKGVLVEPIPARARELRKTFPDNAFAIYEFALADSEKRMQLHVYEGFDPTSSILPIYRDLPELSGIELGEERVIEVSTITLDQIVSKENISVVDLLKIDVQGAEHIVLAGANDALTKTKMVWIEVSFRALYVGSTVFNEVYMRLQQAGFILLEVCEGFRAPSGELLQADCLFRRR